MTPKINKEACIGCGTCPAIAPEVFEMTADGKAEVKNVDFAAFDAKIQQAKDACPVQAILCGDGCAAGAFNGR